MGKKDYNGELLVALTDIKKKSPNPQINQLINETVELLKIDRYVNVIREKMLTSLPNLLLKIDRICFVAVSLCL